LNCCESGVEQPLSAVCGSSESFTRPKPELAPASLLRRVMHAQLEACVHRVVANWRVWLGCSHLKQKEEMERKRADAIKKSSALRKDRTATEAAATAATADYDEDGLRTKWNNAPSTDLKDLRRIWLNTDLRDKLRWNQGQVCLPLCGLG
jgi:hypothetical protein